MRLSENKKQRVQLLALGGIVGLAMLYVAYLGVQGLWVSGRDAMKESAELEEKIAGARKSIDDIRRQQGSTEDICSEIARETRAHFLEAEFGNYFLTARPCTERMFRGLPIELSPFMERGMVILPAPKDSRNAFAGYAVGVAGTATYDGIMETLDAILRTNAYVSVSALSISSSGNPEKHSVAFQVTLPIWASPDLAAEFARSAAGASPRGAKAAASKPGAAPAGAGSKKAKTAPARAAAAAGEDAL